MKTYNWQQADWPDFQYDLSNLYEILLLISEKMGLLSGKLAHLSDELRTEALVSLIVEEAVKTSEIEGEYINRIDIRSSIKNSLGLNPKKLPVHDKRAEGIAELMLDVRNTFNQSLTEKKLFDWHLMLLSRSTHPYINVGYWRTNEEPMQIVSGHHGKWIVHFEAPPSKNVPEEMKKFIQWFNQSASHKTKAIQFPAVRAAISHLYFESIHPFEDGNGRIGRAIAEKVLSQGFGYPVMLSLSLAIESEKKAYYAALNKNSKKNDVTDWIEYFVNLVLKAQINFEKQINFIIGKAKFFDKFKDALNERQLKVIKRMMQTGVKGFEGEINARKYMAITSVSKATATRDLQYLFSINALKQIGGGRSIRYELNL